MDAQKLRQTGHRVRMLRSDLGMRQGQLAEKIGVSNSTISGIETGTTGISRIAGKLATTLGTTTDYLYGLTDDPLPPKEQTETESQNGRLWEIILGEYEQMSEIDKRTLYQIAVTLRLASEQRQGQR